MEAGERDDAEVEPVSAEDAQESRKKRVIIERPRTG
jgi:hypothetical protein